MNRICAQGIVAVMLVIMMSDHASATGEALLVTQAFQAVLCRTPNAIEMTSYTNFLLGGHSYQELLAMLSQPAGLATSACLSTSPTLALSAPPGRLATVGLQPILVLDGTDNFPCDGNYHWSKGLAVNAAIVKTYLFASMNPNGVNGLNAVLWSPLYGGWGSLGTVNLLRTTPSQALDTENERSFSPDSVQVSTVYVGVICWGGGNAQAYAEVFTRVTP